jgi:hypothetical protein
MPNPYQLAAFQKDLHHPLVAAWWEAHKFGVIPPEFLPENGLLLSDESGPIAAGFVYLSDSKMGWLEFLVTNPEANPIRRARALKHLITALTALADSLGVGMLFTSSDNPGLIRMLEGSEFQKGDTGTTQLLRLSHASR